MAESQLTQIERGTLLELGPHRLLCGDSTNPDDWQTLMGTEKANLIFTDPPYGVSFERGKYVGRKKTPKNKNKFAPIANDELRGGDLREFVSTVLKHAYHYSKEASIYCWAPPLSESLEILEAVQEVGFKVQSQIIWNKSPFVIGRSDHHWKHEVCWYGFQEKHHWYGGRNQSTVWSVNKVSSLKYHPTEKPMFLALKAIKNSTQEGDLVLDPFLGGGTTLLAAERLGRRCYAMEIDPIYCEVVRKRYESLVKTSHA